MKTFLTYLILSFIFCSCTNSSFYGSKEIPSQVKEMVKQILNKEITLGQLSQQYAAYQNRKKNTNSHSGAKFRVAQTIIDSLKENDIVDISYRRGVIDANKGYEAIIYTCKINYTKNNIINKFYILIYKDFDDEDYHFIEAGEELSYVD